MGALQSLHSVKGCFPVSHVYFFVGGWPKSIAKLEGEGMTGFAVLPGSATDRNGNLQISRAPLKKPSAGNQLIHER